MRFFIDVKKNSNGNMVFVKNRDNLFCVVSERGSKQYVSKEWICSNIIDIDNAKLSKDSKVIFCKSKQEEVIQYIVAEIRKAMRSAQGFDPKSLVCVPSKWYIKGEDNAYHLNLKMFDMTTVAAIEAGMEKHRFNISDNSMESVLALLARYDGFNFDRDYILRYGHKLVEMLILQAISDENKAVGEDRCLMMINNKSWDYVFYAKKSYREAMKKYSELYEKDPNTWVDGTCNVQNIGWNFYGEHYFAGKGITIGEHR